MPELIFDAERRMRQLDQLRPAATEIFTITPSGVPIWKQIEDGMRRMIARRALRPGDPVPSVRKLARQLSVTPNTVERAYQRLISEGVFVTRRGRGTFVAVAEALSGSERDQTLQDAASRFARIATAVGAPVDEAIDEIVAAYRRMAHPSS
jgi:GntR family transcriptional regulator